MGLTLRGGMRVLQRFREHQGRSCSLSLPQDSFIQEICSCITVHKDKHTRSESTSTHIPKAQLKHSSWNKKSPYSTPETREDIGNKAGFLPYLFFFYIKASNTERHPFPFRPKLDLKGASLLERLSSEPTNPSLERTPHCCIKQVMVSWKS